MKSMRPLIFSSWSAETSTSLSSEGDRWDSTVPPVPRLMLEDVELELRPESVIGDGWQCGNTSCTPIEQFTTIYTFRFPLLFHILTLNDGGMCLLCFDWPVRFISGATGLTVRTLDSLKSLLRSSTIATDWTLLLAPWTTSRWSRRRLQCS